MHVPPHVSRRSVSLTAGYAVLWLLWLADWLWFGQKLPGWSHWIVFSASLPTTAVWMLSVARPARRDMILVAAVASCSYIFWWQLGVFVAYSLVWDVLRAKFVINPFSAIRFRVPPIDGVTLQLNEVTGHAYTVGYGQGTGAGFAGRTQRGRVRLIRLEYNDGDWDQDFGIGSDLNMLIEYGIRTRHEVAERTASRTIAQLQNFPVGKSPPVAYLTGQRNISLSSTEVKILREYLLDKHGMIFGDNGGSSRFHYAFLSMMNRVLPDIRYVAVPLDDVIHRIPYQIPFLSYVAPHGGKQALGWKVDGRWVCYYHPGDIGDAWTDDHSGVPPEIWEFCYQLGTNIFFYAHAEYSKWLDAQQLTE